jgi:hypothetical protein
MNHLDIDFEWENPLAAQGPELRATWARLSLRCGEQVITRMVDMASKSIREGVYLPLYPLAEWLVENWWTLWSETLHPERAGYAHRHSWVFAREGYALPALRIEPIGDLTRLMWEPETLPAQQVEFISRGEVWLSTLALQRDLKQLIQAVITRLEQQGIVDTSLQQEWAELQQLAPDEVDFCRAAGALGWYPQALTEEQAALILEAGTFLPPALLNEFFGVARPAVLAADIALIANSLKDLPQAPWDGKNLHTLRSKLPLRRDLPPWQWGYRCAEAVQESLGLVSGEWGISRLAKGLGLEQDALTENHVAFAESSPFVGLVAEHQGQPSLLLRPGTATMRHFDLCRTVGAYLSLSPDSAALITHGGTYQQKYNRAFAAELLAPAAALKARLGSMKTVTSEQAQAWADEAGVSLWVIQHQLQNHQLAGVVD